MKHYVRRTVTVARSRAVICGKRVDYALIRGGEKIPIYRIRISYEGRTAEGAISSDIENAASFYGRVVRNLVTPCTLNDIIEDYLSKF